MESKKIGDGLFEKMAKSELYTSKGREIEELAKTLGIKLKKIEKDDLASVRKILSKGDPLSKMVIEQRGR